VKITGKAFYGLILVALPFLFFTVQFMLGKDISSTTEYMWLWYAVAIIGFAIVYLFYVYDKDDDS
jgi:hypothetical protein